MRANQLIRQLEMTARQNDVRLAHHQILQPPQYYLPSRLSGSREEPAERDGTIRVCTDTATINASAKDRRLPRRGS